MKVLLHEATLLSNGLGVEEAKEPVADFQADVSTVFLVFVRLLQKEYAHDHAHHDNHAADQVRKKVRKAVEDGVAFEVGWIVADRVCESSSQTGANDAPTTVSLRCAYLFFVRLTRCTRC